MRYCLSLGLVFSLATGCGADLCDAETLTTTVRDARAGDVIQLGACRVEGVALSVPRGVEIEGQAGSILVGNGVDPVLRVDGATVRDLEIEVPASAGIAASGPTVRIEHVTIRVTRGIGVSASAVSDLDLLDVHVTGPVDPLDGSSIPPLADFTTGAFGLVIGDVFDALLQEIEIEKVGPWGVIVYDSALVMQRSEIRDVVGTGLYVDGGTLALEDVTVQHPFEGIQPYPAYGLAATGDAEVSSLRLRVEAGDGVGVLHDSGTAMHQDLEVTTQELGGVWIQRNAVATFEAPSIHDNAIAGLVTSGAGDVTVDGGAVSNTALGLAIFLAAAVESGDGVQVFDPRGTVSLADVTLRDNLRIGALFDLGGASLASIDLVGVQVQGDTLGCLAQDATGLVALGGWDDGVSRVGAVLANDPAQAAALEIVGAIPDAAIPEILAP